MEEPEGPSQSFLKAINSQSAWETEKVPLDSLHLSSRLSEGYKMLIL